MATSYKCKDGDRIDLIVLDNYGSLEMLPYVIAANIHTLKAIPLVLAVGTTLVLPIKKEKVTKIKKSSTLW